MPTIVITINVVAITVLMAFLWWLHILIPMYVTPVVILSPLWAPQMVSIIMFMFHLLFNRNDDDDDDDDHLLRV